MGDKSRKTRRTTSGLEVHWAGSVEGQVRWPLESRNPRLTQPTDHPNPYKASIGTSHQRVANPTALLALVSRTRRSSLRVSRRRSSQLNGLKRESSARTKSSLSVNPPRTSTSPRTSSSVSKSRWSGSNRSNAGSRARSTRSEAVSGARSGSTLECRSTGSIGASADVDQANIASASP